MPDTIQDLAFELRVATGESPDFTAESSDLIAQSEMIAASAHDYVAANAGVVLGTKNHCKAARRYMADANGVPAIAFFIPPFLLSVAVQLAVTMICEAAMWVVRQLNQDNQ